MTRLFAAAAALIAAGAVLGATSPAGSADSAQSVTYLDNSLVRVGVDLAQGGKITYVGPENRTLDLVQDIQQSYYSGPFAVTGYPGWHAFASGGATVVDAIRTAGHFAAASSRAGSRGEAGPARRCGRASAWLASCPVRRKQVARPAGRLVSPRWQSGILT